MSNEQSLEANQLEEVEDLFSLRYSELVIELHQMLQEHCRGYNLYEKGDPWNLGEFIKENSSVMDVIFEEVINHTEGEENPFDDMDDFY